MEKFFTLLKNAQVYAPEYLGEKDILIAGNKIASIGEKLELPAAFDAHIIDLEGQIVTPGFIDSHVHLIGGGGEVGYHSRTPEVVLSKVTTNGITTVVGCLGTDGTTRHMESLLAKARGLEYEGLTTYIYSGCYHLPTPTLTGSVRNDVIIIDKVLGAGEIAVSDHRSSQPDYSDYKKLAAEARVGGILSGKAGVVNIHLGDGKSGMKTLYEITEQTEIPKTQFIPTHINRNPDLFAEGVEWAKKGGFIDITSGVSAASGVSRAIKPSSAARMALEQGVPLEKILMSSDGNGSMPLFDENWNAVGIMVASLDSLWLETRDMVTEEGMNLEDAIQIISTNVAKALKIYPQKGTLQVGSDADLVVLKTKELEISHVWAKGLQMIENGKPIVWGTFEDFKKDYKIF